MASAWGTSWGDAWGDSWGTVAAVVVDTHDGGRIRLRDERKRLAREEFRRTITEAFESILEPELAKIVRPYIAKTDNEVRFEKIIPEQLPDRTWSAMYRDMDAILTQVRFLEELDDEEAIMMLMQ